MSEVVSCVRRNTICGLGGPMMLLAVAQQDDEVPSVRREAIAALVTLLEDDKRKEEVRAALVLYCPRPSGLSKSGTQQPS